MTSTHTTLADVASDFAPLSVRHGYKVLRRHSDGGLASFLVGRNRTGGRWVARYREGKWTEAIEGSLLFAFKERVDAERWAFYWSENPLIYLVELRSVYRPNRVVQAVEPSLRAKWLEDFWKRGVLRSGVVFMTSSTHDPRIVRWTAMPSGTVGARKIKLLERVR